MADLVGTRTELRRAGVNRLQGLCPFHDERTPSFGIDPQRKLFHCFGCGEGGDAFRFVQLTEGLDFKGSLEFLADRYGVQLERNDAYYVRYLWESDEAAPARTYLAGRGLEEAMLREFRVGYAPSAWDRVLLPSRRAGFTDRELGADQQPKYLNSGEGPVYHKGRHVFGADLARVHATRAGTVVLAE